MGAMARMNFVSSQLTKNDVEATKKVQVEVKAHAEKICIKSLEIGLVASLHLFWKKDPIILRFLEDEEQEYTSKVTAMEADTYFDTYGVDFDKSDKEFGGDHPAEVVELYSKTDVPPSQDPPMDPLKIPLSINYVFLHLFAPF
uniref:Uncharacterized protein n=1 Tax=Cannabis sativa TaxID=3483 RepID=A0A803PHI6_CANSA